MVVATLLALALAQSPTPAGVSNDDARVLQAVVKEFYVPDAEAEWRGTMSKEEWARGERVVFRTQLLSKRRGSAFRALSGWIASYEGHDFPTAGAEERQKELAPVRALLAELDDVSGAFRPPPVVALKTLDLGERAVVGEPERSNIIQNWDEMRIPGRESLGPPRTILSVSPPAYSPDGSVAVVTGSAPWSIHSADLLFAFRREGDGWHRLFVRARYYA